MTWLSVPLQRAWKWFGHPVTPREKAEEGNRLADLSSAMEARGMVRSGEHEKCRKLIQADLTARRRRYRSMLVVLIIVLLAGLADPFTSNRLIEAVKGTAIALTAPVALYFSVRTDQATK